MRFLWFILVFYGFNLFAQEDSTFVEEDFDFSDFELAAPPVKTFCNNKVLGQSPTALVGVYYDFMPEHTLIAGSPSDDLNLEDEGTIRNAQRLALSTNIPIISRNNILLNFNLIYERQFYEMENSNGHPLLETLDENGLTRIAPLFTLFKPISERNFFLVQAGFEINGDYSFGTIQTENAWRFPAAVLYGWKPNDRLMYAFGISRTYLGGALNYVPIIYYYHTFRNEKWGIEAVLPARAWLRYRFNSTSLLSLGYNVIGATYALNEWDTYAPAFGEDANSPINANAVELRRSEIRAGLRYERQLFGFFWLSAEAGYRINYSFELDEGGDFLRFWGDDEPYFIENELENTPYFTVGITYTSP
jgi:hypothetical protein